LPGSIQEDPKSKDLILTVENTASNRLECTDETFWFSLRNLPFRFLTQHAVGFPSYSVGGILASSPAIGKIPLTSLMEVKSRN
jgi:hypothetical protein